MKIHHYKQTYKDWYVAAFPIQSIEQQQEMRKWCYQTFGQPGYLVNTAEVRWNDDVRLGEVSFGREGDLAMFLLRWE